MYKLPKCPIRGFWRLEGKGRNRYVLGSRNTNEQWRMPLCGDNVFCRKKGLVIGEAPRWAREAARGQGRRGGAIQAINASPRLRVDHPIHIDCRVVLTYQSQIASSDHISINAKKYAFPWPRKISSCQKRRKKLTVPFSGVIGLPCSIRLFLSSSSSFCFSSASFISR